MVYITILTSGILSNTSSIFFSEGLRSLIGSNLSTFQRSTKTSRMMQRPCQDVKLVRSLQIFTAQYSQQKSLSLFMQAVGNSRLFRCETSLAQRSRDGPCFQRNTGQTGRLQDSKYWPRTSPRKRRWCFRCLRKWTGPKRLSIGLPIPPMEPSNFRAAHGKVQNPARQQGSLVPKPRQWPQHTHPSRNP